MFPLIKRLDDSRGLMCGNRFWQITWSASGQRIFRYSWRVHNSSTTPGIHATNESFPHALWLKSVVADQVSHEDHHLGPASRSILV